MTKQESIFVQDLSAVRIQSFAHAVAARKRFRQLIDEKHAAIKIQVRANIRHVICAALLLDRKCRTSCAWNV